MRWWHVLGGTWAAAMMMIIVLLLSHNEAWEAVARYVNATPATVEPRSGPTGPPSSAGPPTSTSNSSIACEVFVAIITGPAPKHKELRLAQRQSWLKRLPPHCFRFFLGYPVTLDLRAEADEHSDLVFLAVEDLYSNLANKTLRMMEWSARNAQFGLLVKTDDDTYVVWDRFKGQLTPHIGSKHAWLGNANEVWHPFRQGKWAVSWEAYPKSVGPPWTNGFLYAASSDCIAFYATRPSYPRVHLEDIDFALAMEEFGVQPWPLSGILGEGCNEQMTATHYQDANAMRQYAKREAEGAQLCGV